MQVKSKFSKWSFVRGVILELDESDRITVMTTTVEGVSVVDGSYLTHTESGSFYSLEVGGGVGMGEEELIAEFGL